MEIKVNKEIRDYKENIYFGLSVRQFFFSIIACLVAVGLYFILKPYFGIETLSWVCILGAFPFAILGFVTYNGMPAEKFLITWIKSEILTPKELYKRKNEDISSTSTNYLARKNRRRRRRDVPSVTSKENTEKHKNVYEKTFNDIFLDDLDIDLDDFLEK